MSAIPWESKPVRLYRPDLYIGVIEAIGQITSGKLGNSNSEDRQVESWEFRGLPNAQWKSTSTLWRHHHPRKSGAPSRPHSFHGP